MTAKTLRGVLGLLLGLAVLLPAAPALAQSAPPNDDFGTPTTISALPFTDNVDTTGPTSAADDPATCGNNGSVWYAFTPPQNEVISADTFRSDYATVLSVYTGVRGALSSIACNNSTGTPQTEVTFNATAGTTYFFMVSQCCGTGLNGGGQLVFNVSVPAPPANDNFAGATQITALPFTDTADTTAATLEPGEPAPCTFPPLTGSVWYAFTPATSESVSASVGSSFFSLLAAYTGTSINKLTPLGCGLSDQGPFTIHVNAGTTYYFQAGGPSPDQARSRSSSSCPHNRRLDSRSRPPTRRSSTRFSSSTTRPIQVTLAGRRHGTSATGRQALAPALGTATRLTGTTPSSSPLPLLTAGSPRPPRSCTSSPMT